MKIYLLLFLVLIFTFSAFSQTEQISQDEAKINDLLRRSGASFRSGLNALQDGMRQQAGDNFDKSLEVFIYSTVNVQRNQKLSDCYNQLVETIYRIEFPTSQQPPNIRSLSATCGWNISNEVADNVAKLVLTVPTNETNTNSGLITAAVTNNSTQGFQSQEFTALQIDELAQLPLELTDEEKKPKKKPVVQQKPQQIQYTVLKGETWESISARTGVSVQDLRAANGNATVPANKVIIPSRKNINNSTKSVSNTIRIVKAQSGDTVATLAAREKVSSVDVAKFNGLLPTTKLVAGREIKIPLFSNTQINQTTQNNSSKSQQNLGDKPIQNSDGKVKIVLAYFDENLHDPYSMRFVRWSKVIEKSYRGTKYWAVQVKYRAKNTLGAYVLSEQIFYIKNNKIVAVEKI